MRQNDRGAGLVRSGAGGGDRFQSVAGGEDLDDLGPDRVVILAVDRSVDHLLERALTEPVLQPLGHALGCVAPQSPVGLVDELVDERLAFVLCGRSRVAAGESSAGNGRHDDGDGAARVSPGGGGGAGHWEKGTGAASPDDPVSQDENVITTERRDRVLVCTIDRPQRRNAVDAEHLEGLAEAAAQVRADDEIRVLVLAGTGPVFCAGADLSHVEDKAATAAVRRTLDAIAFLPICTVAAVEGPALGAGCQLALACDLRVVGPEARFGIPSSKLGLMVDHWTIEKLAQLAGHGFARSVLLAADTVDAEAALRTGFAQRAGGLDDAIAWATEIAALAPLSIAGQKLALDRLVGRDVDADDVRLAFDAVWTSEDRLEGVRAFQDKRAPRFQGR